MSSHGQGSISFSQKNPPVGPPFVPTSAANGVSVDPVTGKIVLGNDVAGVLAVLLNNREIPMATFSLLFRLLTTGTITIGPEGAQQLMELITSHVTTTRGINVQSSAVNTFTGFRTRNSNSAGVAALEIMNDLLNGLILTVPGSTASGANVTTLTFTGLSVDYNAQTAGMFHRWRSQNTNRMSLLANGNLRVAANNTDNTAKIQADGSISGDKLIFPRNITPYAVNQNQDRGFVITNEGAGALQIINLPATVAGSDHFFAIQNAVGLQVNAPAGTTIRVGTTVSASGGNVASTQVGAVIRLIAINTTQIFAVSLVGTWTVT